MQSIAFDVSQSVQIEPRTPDAEPRVLGTALSKVMLRAGIAFALILAVRVAVQPTKHTVFPIFAKASVAWWQDQSLYVKGELDHYRYPPLFAIVFTPFALLGNVAGAIAWAWFSFAIFLFGLHRFERDAMPGRRAPAARALLFAIAFLGAVSGLWNGQSNALLVGLLLLGGSALVREQWRLAAVCLAGGVALKTTALPILLLTCALWPRPLVWRSIVVLATGLLIPFLTRSTAVVWRQYADWIHHLQATSAERWPGFRDAWTLWLVFQRQVIHGLPGVPPLKQPLHSLVYLGIQLTTALAALAWCRSLTVVPSGAAGEELAVKWRVTLTFAMGATWLMLFGPATEHPTYVFLAPFLAWAFVERRRWPGCRRLITASFVLIMVLGWRALTLPFWAGCPWLIAALPMGAIAFATWLWTVQRGLKTGCGIVESSIHFS